MGYRLTAAVALVATLGFAPQTTRSAAPIQPLYHRDPQHLWNRLHDTLFVRVGPDGRQYGRDRVDPLLWIGSKYLLQGGAHERAVRLLTEFADARGEKLIEDPLKRAILQRDLWIVFDWLAGEHANFEEPALSAAEVSDAAQRLRGPLATVIARLALTPQQIRELPDNYGTAARTGAPPPELFEPAGPWVCVGRTDGPVARMHLGDAGPGKNSVFLLMIRLPGGRGETLQFIDRLRAFDGPLWTETTDKDLKRFLPYFPNPDVPQFPAGTQVALARRALLVDSAGEVAPTRLTERVQIRTYRHIERMTARAFFDAHSIDEHLFESAGQDFAEFRLSRAALFEGRLGGLVPIAADERDLVTFSTHGVDPFEMRSDGQPRTIQPGLVTRSCRDCHGPQGVYSLNSYVPFRLLNGPSTVPARLSELSIADAERTAVRWKRDRGEWRALKALWPQ